MSIYLEWIANAWEQISKELIIKSFKNCALTIALDGSEDNQIQCFKTSGSIPNGCALLQQARFDGINNEFTKLLQEVDFEEDQNNGYKSDISIIPGELPPKF